MPQILDSSVRTYFLGITGFLVARITQMSVTIMNLSKVFTLGLNAGSKWEYSGTSSV